MERQFDRRESLLKVRQIVMKHNENPAILELYGLYRGLEHDYVDLMERAIRAEIKLDQVRKLIGKEDERSDTGRHEPEAARGDLCAGEGGGTG